MKIWMYLLLVLVAVVVLLYFFAHRILASIIRRRIESLTMQDLSMDNKKAFAGLDFDKLKDMLDALSKGVDPSSDVELQNNMKSIVNDLSAELSNKMKELDEKHGSDVKKQKLKQAEVHLDSVLKELNGLLSNKDENFNNVLDRLSEKKDKKEE